jgi:hypothetical protein
MLAKAPKRKRSLEYLAASGALKVLLDGTAIDARGAAC